MHPSLRLLHQQLSCRITLFTRANCSLCTNAKGTLSTVWDKHPFQYKEIDVMTSEGKGWRDLYEFDTPVVHISRASKPEEEPDLAAKAKKLMHRFTAEEVQAKMDEVEAESSSP